MALLFVDESQDKHQVFILLSVFSLSLALSFSLI